MTGQTIIDKFNLQVDDASELSSSEELDLANDVYGDICDDRDWEWLKSTFSGITSSTVPYVALPTNFKKLVPNKDGYSIVFVGADFQEYKVIPFSSRRDYRDQDGYCYIDVPNSRLVFTKQPTSAKAIEYDYIIIAPDLTLSSSPLFRIGFQPMISFGMAARFPSIEQADKTTSYAKDNQNMYDTMLSGLALEDALIKLSI